MRTLLKKTITIIVLSISNIMALATYAIGIDPAINDYQKTAQVSGSLTSIGSDTLANLMTMWSNEYKQLYPKVSVQIQAAGSATAPPALNESIATIGPMSRKMKVGEESEFESQFGYLPTFIPVAIDALSVYVHKDNPIKGLSLAEVDAIFSSGRKCQHKDDINRWSEVGIKQPWATKKIHVFGRNSVSGTYSYFKKKALCKGRYKPSLEEKPGSAAVVEAVANTLNGIGYSGIGYKTEGVRIVPLSKKAGEPYIPATTAAIEAGQYPLARYLYLYVNKKPGQPLATLEAEFIKFVLSRQGQKIVIKDGYIPLPSKVIKQSLAKLQ